MSELREAKRVRRTELYTRSSPSRSPSQDVALQAKFQAQLDHLYGGMANPDDASRNGDNSSRVSGSTNEQGENGFEFRLFSTSTKERALGDLDNVAQRVNLKSPTPVTTEPGFVQPRRSDTYYFANKVSAEQKEDYERAAVSGEDVRKGLEARQPGLEMRWRVLTISSNGSVSVGALAPDVERPDKRRRPGKKRRIVLRKRAVLERAKREAEVKRKLEKDEAESEKRTRRNREKKVKRKEKEKAKKALRVDEPG